MQEFKPSRQDERDARATVSPIFDSLINKEGIDVALSSPIIGDTLRELADKLLHEDWPDTTLTKADRELIATRTSAVNNCFYCMDSHGAFAKEHLKRSGSKNTDEIIDSVKCGIEQIRDPKLKSLLEIAECVANLERPSDELVKEAIENGALEEDISLTIYISGSFAMFNRLVEGFGAITPSTIDNYESISSRIVKHGYTRPKNHTE